MPAEPLLKAHAGAHFEGGEPHLLVQLRRDGLDTVALQCGQRSVNIARSARTTIMDS